jgi:signal transduction histidine kinase
MTRMSQHAYLLLGLSALLGVLAGVFAFAALRFVTAVRHLRRERRPEGAETAFMLAAVEQAVARLREQERAMKARAEASEQLSGEIIASMTSGLLVVGRHEEVRIVNPAGRRLLGLPDGAGGRPLREVLAARRPLADAIGECLSTGRPIVRRALDMGEAGAATHLGVTVSPVLDPAGALQGAICLFTDLTAVVDLEDQLRLKDSLARLGELTAGIAHEFRNGLATIHGYSRLLDLERLPAGYRPYVEGIRGETEALGEVVNRFLTFARPAELTLGPLDLQAAAERAAEEIRSEAQGRGGDVTLRGRFGVIEGDEVLLRQALSNLFRNALEACRDASIPPQIVLEGRLDPERRTVYLTLSDNGPGIDRGTADRIFKPFFTTKAGGTGLGLALVQKIIVTHNGRISAVEAPGGGARFEIVLPAVSS